MPWQAARSDRMKRLPKDWPVIRVRILKRDGYRCTKIQKDGRRCPEKATDVDHVIPGDDHSDANLRSLCAPHHRIKSAREGGLAAARKMSTKRPPERHPGLKRT